MTLNESAATSAVLRLVFIDIDFFKYLRSIWSMHFFLKDLRHVDITDYMSLYVTY